MTDSKVGMETWEVLYVKVPWKMHLLSQFTYPHTLHFLFVVFWHDLQLLPGPPFPLATQFPACYPEWLFKSAREFPLTALNWIEILTTQNVHEFRHGRSLQGIPVQHSRFFRGSLGRKAGGLHNSASSAVSQADSAVHVGHTLYHRTVPFRPLRTLIDLVPQPAAFTFHLRSKLQSGSVLDISRKAERPVSRSINFFLSFS